MEKFNNLKSIPSYLSLQNIDTDMIIPKQFLKTIKRTGLGKSLFYEMRYDEKGNKISDFGINSVISPSFADIFYNNCFKNGILPIKIDEKIVVELAEYCKRKEEIEISLEKQEIKYGNKVAKFELDPFKKKCLMEGLDDIALSMEKISKIDDYEKKLQNTKPWVLNNV